MFNDKMWMTRVYILFPFIYSFHLTAFLIVGNAIVWSALGIWDSWVVISQFFKIWLGWSDLPQLIFLFYSRQLLTDAEKQEIDEACDMAVELNNAKQKIFDYVESRMTFIAPNLSIIVGKCT